METCKYCHVRPTTPSGACPRCTRWLSDIGAMLNGQQPTKGKAELMEMYPEPSTDLVETTKLRK